MANIKISELNPLLTVQDADVIPIVDNAITKKVTAAILRSYTQGNSVLLTGAQTIAGIKTFTAQLASWVATGTAPFSVASTTKVINLNADLLDGLSSADFALSTTTLTAGTGLTGGGDLTANRTFAIDSTVATLTGTQILTNKTITSPIINEILDSNGNEILGFTPIASATDYITIKNGIGVGVPVHISAAGSSANTGIHIEPKGTGLVQITDGIDTTKGIRFRSSGSATSAITLIDAVSSAGRVITLPNATGTVALTSDLTSYVPTTRTVNTTSPLAGGGNLGANLTLSIPQASGSVNGYLASTDFATFNAKQNAITLTTTGTSGAATLVGSTLNIPNYLDTDTGITSLNGLTALTQTFAVGTSGTDFGISSATSTHTFNLPTASASNRGALSSADWTTFNNKQNALTNPVTGTGTTNYLPKFTGASALGNSLVFDNGTNVGIGTATPIAKLTVNELPVAELGSTLYGSSVIHGQNYNLSNIQRGIVDINYIDTAAQDNGSTLTFTNNAGVFGYGYSYVGVGLKAGKENSSNQNQATYFAISTNSNSGFTERMRITSAGNVGIGTTSPSAKLDVFKGSQSNTITRANAAGYFYGVDIGLAIGQLATAPFGTWIQSLTNTTDSPFSLSINPNGGNVSIGTTTDTGDKLNVNGTARVSGAAQIGGNLTVSKSDGVNDVVMKVQQLANFTAAGIPIVANNDGGAAYNFIYSATNGGTEHWRIGGNGASNSMSINTAGVTRLTINSSGTSFVSGLSLSGATAPASGIEFPATQVASASANNLDDYEEGDWTPFLTINGNASGITYASQVGKYTKIGRQVNLSCHLVLSSKGINTGLVNLAGLPFTIPNNLPNLSALSLRVENITFLNFIQAYGVIGNTFIGIEQSTALGVTSNLLDSNFSNSSGIIIDFTYSV